MATVASKGAAPEDGNPQDAGATAPLSSWLLGLPPELQVEIFTHLERADLCRLQAVCWQTKVAAMDGKIWRHLMEHDFGVITGQNTGEAHIEAYKRFYRWGWDECHKNSCIQLSNNGLSARCTLSSYCPVRGSRGVNCGIHYFGVRIDENPGATYQAFGVASEYSITIFCYIGIDTSRSYLGGWTEKDYGIGWYNDGNVYVRGELFGGRKFPQWHKGDSIGILLDLDCKKPFLCFYKNGVQIPTKIEVTRANAAMRLYPYCFLGKGEAVTFEYLGTKGLETVLKKSVV